MKGKEKEKLLKSGKMARFKLTYLGKESKHFTVGLVSGHANKYFPHTKKGMGWAEAHFKYLEQGNNAYNSQEFRDYLENHSIYTKRYRR